MKLKDGYKKLIGTSYNGDISLVLLSNGGNLGYAISSTASTLVLRNTNGLIESSIATSANLSPFKITSTYLNTNLNADLLDNYQANTLLEEFTSTAAKNLHLKIGGKEIDINDIYATFDAEGNNIVAKYVTLDTAQTISGVKTFSSLQKFTYAGAPFTVSNSTVVVNLNADLLDGVHKEGLLTTFENINDTDHPLSIKLTVGGTTKYVLTAYSTNANLAGILGNSTNASYPLLFTSAVNASTTNRAYLNIYTDTANSLYYNPSTNVLRTQNLHNAGYATFCDTVYLHADAGDSPHLIFLRGTLIDGVYDWELFVSGGVLTFRYNPSTSSSTSWLDVLTMYPSMLTTPWGITAAKFVGNLNNTLTFAAGAFAAKTYNNSAAVTVNIPTHTSHLTNNSDFITSAAVDSKLANYVTLTTALTITGLKTFLSNSSTTGISLVLKNSGWTGNMSTAMDFYNGSSYTVPNARIETKMVGSGTAGGTLIFYTQTKHASTNPNPNGLTERLRISDSGLTTITGALTVTGDCDFSAGTIKFDTISIPTTSGGTTYGVGSSGQVLKSNGTTVYWASDNNSDTWRPVSVNGTSVATSTTGTGTLNIVLGTGITVSGAVNSLTITNAGVRSVTIGTSTNADKLAVNTNGSTTYLTIPYATTAANTTVILHNTNDTEYPLIWSNQNNNSTKTANLLYKSYSDLTYNPKNKRITANIFKGNLLGNINPFTNLSYTSGTSTVKNIKDALVTAFSNINAGIGANVVVPAYAINYWSTESTVILSSNVYSMIKIGGGYSGTTYGLWLLSTYASNRIGYVGRDDNAWGSVYWLATTTDIDTLKNYYWANVKISSTSSTTTTPTFGGLTVNGTSILNGLVGIGVLSPKAKLAVNISSLGANPSSGSLGTLNTMSVGAAGSYGTYFWTRGSGKGYILVGREDGTATVYDLILQILGGNVGIGIESPIHRLQVAGAGVFSNTGSTTYASDGITIGAGDVAARYITCYGKTGLSYINIGYNAVANNSGELHFSYSSSGSTSNYVGLLLYGAANCVRIYPGLTQSVKHISAPNYISSVATGTLPYACTSTTLNTNLNADLLDGYHASSFELVKVGTATPTGTSVGWYRCAQISSSNAGYSQNVIISLQRSYNSPQNEHYIFAISIGYNGLVNISLISGCIGGLRISLVRVVYNNSGACYFDYYMLTSNYNNSYKVQILAGDCISYQNPTLVSSAGGTEVTFATINGMKTNYYMYAAHFYENSDIMLKTNINPISNSDNMPILKEFDWKRDGTHGYGLIAQELEAMGYSELVDGEEDGSKTVNYSAALSLIVGKLQVKIKELEKEIEILKNKN